MKCVALLLLFVLQISNQGIKDFYQQLSNAALSLTADKVEYNPAYVVIKYPGGDVPANTGVCTDVIIRAYRKLGIDLQKEVHEDMSRAFSVYPKIWGRKTPDKNIDHRRVPNLATFFKRKGTTLPVSSHEKDYSPGDIVCWLINNRLPHIGIVVAKKSADGKRWLMVHNVGAGQVMEDCLFSYTITGHYRYKK